MRLKCPHCGQEYTYGLEIHTCAEIKPEPIQPKICATSKTISQSIGRRPWEKMGLSKRTWMRGVKLGRIKPGEL